MRFNKDQKAYSALAACFLLIAFALANLLAQQTQPSPQPSTSGSPTPSVTPTPARSPSPTPLPGAQNFHQWGSITVFNGLPSDSVRAIAQTFDGVMWFGTDNGLARFDGRRIQNFSPGESDGSKSILALKYDEKAGALFIGTRSGAFVYVRDRFEPLAGTEGYSITTILLWDKLYLGTDSGFILRQSNSNETGRPVFEPMIPNAISTSDGNSAPITSLVNNGEYLVAGTVGRGVLAIRERGPEEFRGWPNTPIANTLLRDHQGAIWIGSDAPRNLSGLYAVASGRTGVRIGAPTSKVLSLEENDTGVWVGSERFGLFHIIDSKLKKNYTFENTSGGLRSNTIFTLFTDREGVLWIGTNRGASRFDRQGSFQQTVSEIPNSNFIRTLYQAPGEEGLLYAGSNRGLFTLDRTEEVWNELSAFRNKVIYAIRKRYRSTIVVGGPEGLFDLTGRRLLSGDVRAIAGFNVRDYAAVFGKGIYDITDDVPKLVLADPTITALGERWNKLWIGTLDRGLFSYAGKTLNSEADADKLRSGTIWNIRNVSNGRAIGPAYVAGQHGVFIVHEDNNIEQVLTAEDVRDVVERDGRIWAASTTRGLLQARRDDRFGWIVSKIGFEQGLPSEKAFSIQPAGDELIVATNRGVVTYRPGTIAPKLIPTRILSQRVHDLAELRWTIPLEYPQNSLLLEVAGQSSRTFPEEFQYAFLLKNSKGEEIARQLSNDPQYAPSELSPGDYTIEVTAFNRDLLPSEPLSVGFSVAKAPFPWTATALGVLLAIAVIALIWAIVERRRIVLRNRELATARFDLAHEAERERSRIARDLHDQTLADLRDLIMKSDRELAPGSGFRDEIESISTEIRRICEDLSPSVLENVGLIASLQFLLDHTVPGHRFDRGTTTDEDIDLPMNVQLQIYRIAQEVLTNIKQHANASLVEMNVASNGTPAFELTVLNDGDPFTPVETKTRGGRGIAGIRTRASLIQAKAEWDILPDGRSRFRLTL